MEEDKYKENLRENWAYAVAQAIYFLSFEIVMGKVEVANHTPYWSAINDTMVILEHPDFRSDGILKLSGNFSDRWAMVISEDGTAW